MLLNKRCMDNSGDNNFSKNQDYMNMSINMMDCCNTQMPGVVCQPIYECPQIRCCHREICHEVPHIVPIQTKIINHHIYRHTYQPSYSCCEENEVCNIYDNKCF